MKNFLATSSAKGSNRKQARGLGRPPSAAEIIAHGSLVGVLNSCCRPHHHLCGTRGKGRRDCLEWTCHRGKRRTTTTDSSGIDADRGISEKVFWLQPISGDRPISKDTQDWPGRLACN